MKYIVVKDGPKDRAIAFSEELVHAQVAHGLRPVSAGFYYFYNGTLIVTGRSDSLNLDSKPGDHDLLMELFK